MTWDERVRSAVEAFGIDGWATLGLGDIRNSAKATEMASQYVREILAAAFPELHGDQPKGWIAPWESDGAMDDAAHLASEYKWIGADPMVVWAAMRDAYLGKGDGG